MARKEVVRTSRQRRDNDDDYNSLFLRVIKKKESSPIHSSGAIFLLNYTVERVITRVSKESPSDFFTFPNIRTSLSFSFFIGRAALYSAPKLDDGRLSTCTRNETSKSWSDLWDWIEEEGRQGMENYRNARLGTCGVRWKERFCTQNVV